MMTTDTTTTDTIQQKVHGSKTAASQDTVESQDLTKFVNDSQVNITTLPSVYTIPKALLGTTQDNVDMSIKSFLSRPILLSSGSLSTTDTAGSVLFSIESPHDLLAVSSVWTTKLNGVIAFRATLRLRVQVNATRFQAGRYILGFVHSGGMSRRPQLVAHFSTHTATLVEQTQTPHAEIDVSCDTQAELVVPHVSCTGYSIIYNNGAIPYSVGTAYMSCYSPLVAVAGSTTADYNIYASWEDIELSFPVVPQSSGSGITKRIRRRIPAIEEQEEQSLVNGPITTMLQNVSKSTAIAAEIPYVGSFAAPVSWVTAILSKAAAVWGWSKPHNSSPIVYMTPAVLRGFTNADGLDNSSKLAITGDAKLSNLVSLTGQNVDEMSIDYIKSIPAFYRNFAWTTSAAEDTQLFIQPLSPRQFITNETVAGNTITHSTPVAFLSRFFDQYRGSITFRVKLVKTEFHSGRLAVTYIPYDRLGSGTYPTPVDVYSGQNVHREIIDIRMCNEFTLTCPYYSATPYRRLEPNSDGPYGFFEIRVLNALVAPDTVSSSVQVLIEVFGNDDLEYAVPIEACLTNAFVEPQSADDPCSIIQTDIGAASTSLSIDPAQYCVGEKILSTRSLIKRFNFLNNSTNRLSALTYKYLVIEPFAMITATYTPTTVTFGQANSDLLSLLAAPFALYRGGMRYKLLTAVNTDNFVYCNTTKRAATFTTTAMTGYQASNPHIYAQPSNEPNSIHRLHLTAGVESEVPFYSRTHAAPVGDLLVSTNFAIDYTEPIPSNVLVADFATAVTATDVNIFRAAADDASLGVFISTVPLLNW